MTDKVKHTSLINYGREKLRIIDSLSQKEIKELSLRPVCWTKAAVDKFVKLNAIIFGHTLLSNLTKSFIDTFSGVLLFEM